MNYNISVIIPIYNSAKYLEKCIDSVINQSYRDLEILLIDDGSTDESLDICYRYASNDSRIVVIHQENKGNVEARRTGLKNATAEVISFIDSDDWIEPEFYSSMIEILDEEPDVDVIATGIIRDDEKEIIQYNECNPGIYTKKDMEEKIYPRLFNGIAAKNPCFIIQQYLVNKLYKRELIQTCFERLDNRIYDGEDVACMFDVLLNANKIVVKDIALYHYVVRKDSVCTQKRGERYFRNVLFLYDYINNIFMNSEYRDTLKPQLKELMVMFMNNGMLSAFNVALAKKYDWTLPEIPNDRHLKIALFGAGKVGQSFYKQLMNYPNIDVDWWVDNGCAGTMVCGQSIIKPSEIVNSEFDYLVLGVSDSKHLEILDEIIGYGIDKRKILHGPTRCVLNGLEVK